MKTDTDNAKGDKEPAFNSKTLVKSKSILYDHVKPRTRDRLTKDRQLSTSYASSPSTYVKTFDHNIHDQDL